MQKSKKTTKNTRLLWPVLIIAAIVLVISIAAIALKTMGNSSDLSVKAGEEFSMKTGDIVHLSDIEDATLKLESIEDGRCPSGGDIVCFWQGQLYYRFNYEESTITIGSVLESNQQQALGDTGYVLHFVSGDETTGTFILRKEEK